MQNIEFTPFPKMARFARDIIVTEKIDGTNASIYIGEDGTFMVGSRTRWIDRHNDNFGFANWALDREDEIKKYLPPGHHFGEWWGNGIQRGYGMDEKRFSFFNTQRFVLNGQTPGDGQFELPPFIGLVPLLWRGEFDTDTVNGCAERLRHKGSAAAPGFMKPEGIVVFHTAANTGFKMTLENDETPKSLQSKGV